MFVAFGVFDECRLKGVVVVSAACLLFFQILFISVAELEPVLFFINIVIVQAVGAAAEQAG